jgi:hypothetical protein
MTAITDFWLFRWCFHPTQIIPSRKPQDTVWNIKQTIDNIRVDDFINFKSTKDAQIKGTWKFKSVTTPKSFWVYPDYKKSWCITPGHYIWNSQKGEWTTEKNKISFTDNEPQICPWSECGLIQNNHEEWAMDYWGIGTTQFELNYFKKCLEKRMKEGIRLRFNEEELSKSLLYNRWASMSVFTGDTPVIMHDGTTKFIKDIQLGDKLWDNNIVVGVCEAKTNTYEWVNIHNIKVSRGTWTLNIDDSWTSVTDYDIVTPPNDNLCYTIATTQNQFEIQLSNIRIIVRDGLGWYSALDDAEHYNALIRQK